MYGVARESWPSHPKEPFAPLPHSGPITGEQEDLSFPGSYPTWESEDIKHENYCPPKAFWFSAKSLVPLVVLGRVYWSCRIRYWHISNIKFDLICLSWIQIPFLTSTSKPFTACRLPHTLRCTLRLDLLLQQRKIGRREIFRRI